MFSFESLTDDSARDTLKSSDISRRDLCIGFPVAAALCILGLGCQRTVTRYKPDGTPYDDKEDDWVATLAAIILLAIIVAAIAANRQDDDDAQVIPRKRLFDPSGEEIIDSKDLLLTPEDRIIPIPPRTLCNQALRYFQSHGFELRGATPLVAMVVAHKTRPDAFVLESIRKREACAQPLKTPIVQTQSHTAHAIRVDERIEIALVPRIA